MKADNNRVEGLNIKTMTKQEIFTEAHRIARMKSGYGTYKENFSIALKRVYKKVQEAKRAEKLSKETTQQFIFSIAYHQKQLRKDLKRMGAKWQPESKTWVVDAKPSEVFGYGIGEHVVASTEVAVAQKAQQKAVTSRQRWTKHQQEEYDVFGVASDEF